MDLTATAFLLSLGVAFLTVAATVVWKQLKASSCHLHRPKVGRTAIAIAIFSGFVGMLLIGTAIVELVQLPFKSV